MRTRLWKRSSLAVLGLSVLLWGAGIEDVQAGCGDFNDDGTVSASDALGVLGTAVGSNSCPKARCDIDNNGAVGASDALGVLQSAVGQSIALNCPGVAVSTIGDLPRATGAVVADKTGNAFTLNVEGDPYGILLGNLQETFTPDSSMAACEIANMTRIAVSAAAEADKILCYIQNAFEDVVALDDGETPIDIYDGQYHLFALDFGTAPGTPGDKGGPSLVKMRLVKTGDTITEFEMFACDDTDSGPEQREYVRQIISSTDFSMTAKGMFEDDWGSNAHAISVLGDLNDFGQFIGTKEISLQHTSSWDQNSSGWGGMNVGQSADALELYGFDAGEFDDGQQTNIYSHRVFSLADLFDYNTADAEYDIGLLAIGDGAAKVTSRFGTRYQWSDWTEVQGWNGGTTALEYDNPFVDLVLDEDLPEVEEVTIAFGDSERFDCTGEPEAIVSVDMFALDQACNYLDMGQEWIDCWSLVNKTGGGGGPGPGPGPEPGPAPCEGPDCTCVDSCGLQAPGGCWCDAACLSAGDCCPDKCDVCGECDGGGVPCDPATDPNCEPPCDPATDPNCAPPCDPATDPNCEPPCDPAVDPNCPSGFCGDGWCGPDEDPSWCPQDCGQFCDPATDPNCEPPCDPAVDPNCEPPCDPATDPNCEPPCDPAVDPNCPSGFCGDGWCGPDEDPSWCPQDCGQFCDPATDPNCEPPCDPATDPNCEPPCDPATDPNCEPPCDPAVDPNCPSGFCGDGWCGPDEDPSWCPQDCGQFCDPATDPNCEPPCDPATDPNCEPPCDPNVPGDCPQPMACEGPGCSCAEAPACGEKAPGGCFCDAECVAAGDCCPDVCEVCGVCPQ